MAYLDSPIRFQEVRSLYLERLMKPTLSAERARIVTDSYSRTRNLPLILRRAEALKSILEEMSIYIRPWELLAGNLGPEPVSAPIYPEGGVDFILDEIDTYPTRPGDKFAVSEETRSDLMELLPRWQGQTLKDYGLALMPEEAVRMREAGVFAAENMLTCGTGHFLPDYRRILSTGFARLRHQAATKLETIDLSSAAGYEQRDFYKSVLIICDAVEAFSLRYAELADSMAAEEPESARKQELEQIAEACRQVPMEPAHGFRQALQSLWMTHLICYIDSNGYGVTLGRSAAYLYPYYRQSIDAGELTPEDAVTLISSFYFKTNDILKLYNNAAAQNYGGFPVGQPVQLGGINADGGDDSNELAFLFLEAERKVKLYQPDIGLLWTEKMDPAFLEEAVSLVASNSKPKFFNYHVGSQMYKSAGLPDEVAEKEWAFIGCVEYGVPGKTWTWADAALFNLAKCFELTLNDGLDPVGGEQLGPHTGEAEELTSFELLFEAFKEQVRYMFERTVRGITALQIAHRERWPEPYESLLVSGCLEKGREVNRGGADSYQTGVQFVGLATTIDSLLAVDTFVYRQNEISLSSLRDDLRNNFAGNDLLRVKLFNGTPPLRPGRGVDQYPGSGSLRVLL